MHGDANVKLFNKKKQINGQGREISQMDQMIGNAFQEKLYHYY